ncbi:MAG TPA: GAF domain-containing sensor histidine kinase, partial [Terriglobia bacterium]|nr:GAF domain-containing sensor histidine kinase [Terriglobia bacterium]
MTLFRTSFAGRPPDGEGQPEHPFTGKRGPFKWRLVEQGLSGGPFVIREVADSPLVEPEVREWMRSSGIKSLFCIPLIFGKKTIGLLTIRGATADAFPARKKYLGVVLGHYVSLAVSLDRLAGRAEEAAVLEERTRIAQEIHDSLAQYLVAVVTRLELASSSLAENPDECAVHLQTARDMAREGLAEARRAVWALVPAALEHESLAGALRKMAAHLNEATPVDIQFAVEGSQQRLGQDTETNLFRISQEAVNNALRHAAAERIRVRLAYQPEKVVLSIEDDGNGLSCEDGAARGFGLVSLRERAKRAGGQATILSEPGMGTHVVVEVPLASQSPEGVSR